MANRFSPEYTTRCYICQARVGEMCHAAGRVGAEKFTPHVARVVASQMMHTGVAEHVAWKSQLAAPVLMQPAVEMPAGEALPWTVRS